MGMFTIGSNLLVVFAFVIDYSQCLQYKYNDFTKTKTNSYKFKTNNSIKSVCCDQRLNNK